MGIFPREVKDTILREVRLHPHETRLKRTSEKWENSEKSEKPKFPFQVEGTFGGVPDMGMGFQTWGWGPDMGMGFQTRGGVPDMGWNS